MKEHCFSDLKSSPNLSQKELPLYSVESFCGEHFNAVMWLHKDEQRRDYRDLGIRTFLWVIVQSYILFSFFHFNDRNLFSADISLASAILIAAVEGEWVFWLHSTWEIVKAEQTWRF